MKSVLAAALCLAAGAAAADSLAGQPFLGIWTADPAWCQFADQIGSHDPAPIRISEEGFDGYENSCVQSGLEEGEEIGTWVLSQICQGEGEAYDQQILLQLAEPNVLLIDFGDGDPVRFTRCGG